MALDIDRQARRWEPSPITDGQRLLHSGRRGQHSRHSELGPAPAGAAPLHARHLTLARYRRLFVRSAGIDPEHVPTPRIELDEQPVYKIIT